MNCGYPREVELVAVLWENGSGKWRFSWELSVRFSGSTDFTEQHSEVTHDLTFGACGQIFTFDAMH